MDNTYLYIPPYPFKEEVSILNMFIHQKQPQNLTILNSNSVFSRYCSSADEFIKSELAKRKINVIYNTNLHSVNKDDSTLIFTSKETH